MAKEVTQSEYARMRGCNLRTVSDAINQGQITARKDGKNVWIDPEKADKEWDLNRNRQGKSSGKAGVDEYSKARTLREKAAAEKAVLQVAEIKGTLIKKEDVRRQGFEAGRKIRSALESLPSRLAPNVAVITDPHECEIFMKEEIEKILVELCTIDGYD